MNSSVLMEMGYDPQAGTLEVMFPNGRVYQYSGVPAETHQAILNSDSPGSQFNALIRGLYPEGEV
jgi:hypothetical protein